MKKYTAILTLMFATLFNTNLFAQTLDATVSQDVVRTGEAFVLTLTYNGPKSYEKPDLSVLNGFTTLSTSQSYQLSMINGKSVSKEQWKIGLKSDAEEGKILIPAISLGQLKSKPIEITIDNSISNPEILSEASQAQNTNGSSYRANAKKFVPYSVRSEVSNKTPYVQEEIKYKLILKDIGNLQIATPSFSDQSDKNWVIKSLGDPDVKMIEEDGVKMREITFEYVLFPKKSGEIELPIATVAGYYFDNSKGEIDDNFSAFFNDKFFERSGISGNIFSKKVPVTLRTLPEKLEVKPRPSSFSGAWWLPAKDVKLSAKWETQPANFMVGEAISRKIYIEAVGVIDSQIPSLDFGTISGAKQYPEKPLINTYIKGENIVTIAEISNIYIPSQSGEIIIPEIELPWFDTINNSMKTATLPATQINVKPNPNYSSPKVETPQEVNNSDPAIEFVDSDTPLLPSQDGPFKQEISPSPFEKINHLYDYVFIAAIFFFGVFVGLLISRKPKENVKAQYEVEKKNIDISKKSVISAAKAKDFKLLRESLIHWATERYHDDSILNLNDVLKYVKNPDMQKEINVLSATLYAKDMIEWNPNDFINAFEKECKNRVILSKQNSPLPNLYK